MATRRRNRAGICLVETLVGLMVGSAVIATAWSLVGTTMRGGGRTDAALAGVEAVLGLSTALERDLRCLYEDGAHPLTVKRSGHRLAVSFFRCLPAATGAVQAVRWDFDGRTGRVHRQAGDEPRRAVRGSFRAVDVRATSDGAVEFDCTAVIRDRAAGMTVRGGTSRPQVVVRGAYPHWNEIPYAPSGDLGWGHAR